MKIKETTKKTSEILAEMKSLFTVWSYYSDEELDKQFPPPKELTEREFLDSVEPDEATLGKSAIEADPEQKGITLRERMLMEIQYFRETGKHLDIKGATICSGSRGSDGGVPDVCWFPGYAVVCVDAYGVGYSRPADGLRSAVSLSSLNSLTLQNAIDEVKKAGYKVIKEF